MAENPKHYAGQAKIPFSDVPHIVMAELGIAMHEGARKYGSFNYRQTPIKASDYFDAVKRHMIQWFELGEDVDATCGISHITKAMAALAVLRDAQISGRCIDDRPPPANAEHWAKLEKAVQALRAKYPEPKERVTEWGDNVIPEKTYPEPGNDYQTALEIASQEIAREAAKFGTAISKNGKPVPLTNWLAGVECGEFPVDGLNR